MKNDVFGFWKETQERIWKNLSKTSNPFDFRQGVGFWQQPNFKAMIAWGESATKQSLELQSSWLRQWTERVKLEGNDPEILSRLLLQLNESMERWTQTQKQLWEFWFKTLDTGVDLSEVSGDYAKTVDVWKSAVHDSLSEQSSLLAKWQQQIGDKSFASGDLEELGETLRETMQGWVQNQTKLWQYGFDSLKTGDGKKR